MVLFYQDSGLGRNRIQVGLFFRCALTCDGKINTRWNPEMRTCTQTTEGEVALRADSYTPRFAFTLHLKLILVCVYVHTRGVGGPPDS